jgi:hypothetical protein
MIEIKKSMLKNIFIILLLIVPISFFAQKSDHEFGAFAGVSYYMGDLNQTKLFSSIKPTIGIIYKIDINPRYAIRFSGIFGSLSGSDANSKNGYQLTRNYSFHVPISEFATMIEYHFFPYIPESRYNFITPYVSVGIGALIIPSQENKIPVKPVIPFGIGCKYALNKRFGIAVEWTYRKTFTDYIDQLPDDAYNQTVTSANKQRSFLGSKDWYSFAGISLTYKFAIGSSKCPAYRY